MTFKQGNARVFINCNLLKQDLTRKSQIEDGHFVTAHAVYFTSVLIAD